MTWDRRIVQFQTTDIIGNEDVEKKQSGKRCLHRNGSGLKKFAQNLIAGIRKLLIIEKPFCYDILQKNNQLKNVNYIMIMEY